MTILQAILKQLNWDIPVNDNFRAVSAAGAFGIRDSATTGLTLGYYGGVLDGVAYADGTHALTASTTRYVVAKRSDGVVSSSTGTTNWNNTTDYLRMGIAVVGSATITSWTDWREAFGVGGGGGGGAVSSVNGQTGSVVLVLDDIDDVDATAPADGDVLTFDVGTNTWIPVAPGGGGGSGTVTSVAASEGVETTSGSPITATGTIRTAVASNPQTGTTYTYVTGDRAKIVTHSNAAAIAATLPAAVSTFGAGWHMLVKNIGAGTLTITPTTSTINGSPTLVLTTGQWAWIVSDGSDYTALVYAPSGGGGGLTNFAESANSSAPNASIPVMLLAVSNGASDVDFALGVKGLGSILAALPDSTSNGGNKRGFNAVDLQLNRSAAADVASGNYSGIFSGRYNKAGGRSAVVAGGEGNSAAGDYAFAAGSYNTASGNNSVAVGDSNTASGTNATALGGSTNTANAPGATIVGGVQATVRGIGGMWAYSAGQFSANGDAQVGRYVSRVATSNATPAEATTNSGAISTNNAAILPNNSVFVFEGTVVAKVGTFGDRASYRVSGQISRGANAAATQIDGTPTVTTIAAIGGASAWVVAVSADTSNGGLKVTVTGSAATDIKWVADIRTVEVVG